MRAAPAPLNLNSCLRDIVIVCDPFDVDHLASRKIGVSARVALSIQCQKITNVGTMPGCRLTFRTFSSETSMRGLRIPTRMVNSPMSGTG